MPVLALIKERFEKERPLAGIRIAACLHVTTETANLMLTLAAGGAEVALCASNPLSTQDDVAAALVEAGIDTYAIKGEDTDTFFKHINAVLDVRPNITMDDGADMVSVLHKERVDQIAEIIGGTEETTTGVIRLRAMAADGALKYPIVSVNDADTKHLFDNRFGTGQSTIDAIMRATNRLLAGRTIVVCGYGMCGRGVVVARARDGRARRRHRGRPHRGDRGRDGGLHGHAAPRGGAGRRHLHHGDGRHQRRSRREHMELMKDGAMLANSGHFDVEIDKPGLAELGTGGVRRIREFVDEYTLADGRRLYLLGEGRLVNLSAAEGHPAAVMDMSFANQALAAEWVVQQRGALEPRVYPVPVEIDKDVARLKLRAMGVEIDELTAEQDHYLHSWEQGT